MIKYVNGDLLDVNEGVIIHGCNAKGVMGSGVALAVKHKYPKVYEAYKAQEKNHGLNLGSFSTQKVSALLYVANLVIQEHYGRDSNVKYVSYGAILLGFEKLNDSFPESTVFNFPKIGAGLGNGDWNDISTLIEFACPNRALYCWQI